jgi:hypothetical protein
MRLLCDLSHWLALLCIIVAGVTDVPIIQYAMIIGSILLLTNIRIQGGGEEALADGTLVFAVVASAIVAVFGMHPLPVVQAVGLVVGYTLAAILDNLAWKPAWHSDVSSVGERVPIYPRSLGEKALELGVARGSVVTCDNIEPRRVEVVEIHQGGHAAVIPSTWWNHPLMRQSAAALVGGAVMVLIQTVL